VKEALRRRLLPLVPGRWHRSSRLIRLLEARLQRNIVAGPFRGLRYVDRSYSSAYWPKLLGTYELELRESFEEILARSFDLVLVPGAAEGYYVVGIAARLRDARVVGWEASAEARSAAEELARLNAVEDRVELRAICDIGELASAGAGHDNVLVVADVDGGESILLDPSIVPFLRDATVVVEVHDCFVPGTSALLERRFLPSHEVRRVAARPRRLEDAPALDLPAVYRGALTQLLSERRPAGNDWLVMNPRSRS